MNSVQFLVIHVSYIVYYGRLQLHPGATMIEDHNGTKVDHPYEKVQWLL